MPPIKTKNFDNHAEVMHSELMKANTKQSDVSRWIVYGCRITTSSPIYANNYTTPFAPTYLMMSPPVNFTASV